ncbi:hypothetical protein KH5H1_33170 [Corallococcus caeni]|uniref:hypothetical protein n=1 Tax=Corallococcus caeni TaxID=3082388 RepID=UPI002957A149|nr:hypothetical protein KH5H1_33170 [Corallococcus sp. KH5-1]
MRFQWGLGLTCLLFGASAGAADPDIRASFKTDYREQGFEQMVSASAYDRDDLPAEGHLEGPYVRLIHQVARPKNNFKFITWVLCVSPTSEEDGTDLIIDSVQYIPKPEKDGPDLIVNYRRVKAPGNHTTSRGWPYALLVARGLHEKVRCQAVPE